MKFKVKFEIYGKKMKTEIEALSREHAKNVIREKIIFHTIDRVNPIDEFIKGFGR